MEQQADCRDAPLRTRTQGNQTCLWRFSDTQASWRGVAFDCAIKLFSFQARCQHSNWAWSLACAQERTILEECYFVLKPCLGLPQQYWEII